MNRKVVVALAAGLLFYALSDILLWQRIFEANHLWKFDPQYQTGHVAILVALIGTGMILLLDARWWSLWYGLAFYTLAFGGIADVLYYWLDGRAIPAVLPWLDTNRLILFHPVSSWSLLASSAVWLGAWSATLAFGVKIGHWVPSPLRGRDSRIPTPKRIVDTGTD